MKIVEKMPWRSCKILPGGARRNRWGWRRGRCRGRERRPRGRAPWLRPWMCVWVCVSQASDAWAWRVGAPGRSRGALGRGSVESKATPWRGIPRRSWASRPDRSCSRERLRNASGSGWPAIEIQREEERERGRDRGKREGERARKREKDDIVPLLRYAGTRVLICKLSVKAVSHEDKISYVDYMTYGCFISLPLSLSLSIFFITFIPINVCVCVCVCACARVCVCSFHIRFI